MDPRLNHITSFIITFHSRNYKTYFKKRQRLKIKYLQKGYKLIKDFSSGNDAIGYTATLTFSL